MSNAMKVLLCLVLVLTIAFLTGAPTFAQDEAEISIEISQHETNTWRAKTVFWQDWVAAQQVLAETLDQTWEAKTAFWHEWETNRQLMAEHIAATWRAKATFWLAPE